MSNSIKSLLLASVFALGFSGTVVATAQDDPPPPEEEETETPEPAGAGGAVSEAAQQLSELDPDEVEGPGKSAAAQELQAIAQANLPEQALENRNENAGIPGRPETFDVPERPERPDRPARPERPERPERPARPERPERPGRN